MRETIFGELHACSLARAIDALVEACNERSGPHRPQVQALRVMVEEASSLPAYVGDPTVVDPQGMAECAIYTIFEHGPSLTNRTPEPLLWLVAKPLAAEDARMVQACARRSKGPCCGRCRGEVLVSVDQSPLFPLNEREVNYLLATRCGCREHAWCELPRVVESLAATLERLANRREPRPSQQPKLLCAPPAASHSAAVPKRRTGHVRRPAAAKGAGAPCLRVNVWLERAIERLPEPGRYHHLKQEYLRRHLADTGHELVDADRSFTGAARRCIARIGRRRALAGQAGEAPWA